MSKIRINIFAKVVIMILLLLIPIVILFTVSNQTAVRVIQNEVKASYFTKLSFLLNQVDSYAEQLSTNSILLVNDPSIRELQANDFFGEIYDRHKLIRMIQGHIKLQSTASRWSNDISIYSLNRNDVISTNERLVPDDEQWLDNVKQGWQYRTVGTEDKTSHTHTFVWYSVYPVNAYSELDKAKLIIQANFSSDNLVKVLDDYKAGGKGNPFFYHPDFGTIANSSTDAHDLSELVNDLSNKEMKAFQTEETIDLNGQKYMISYIKSAQLGWYLVDYVPLQEILTPITASRNWFYLSTALLLILSVIASALLYRHVQAPIGKLIANVQRIKRGDYSARVTYRKNNEFRFLFERFNEMAYQIQELIENVYTERIRSRDATLKQLQSQINPHFLYNCLFFIKNAAKLGDEEAVVAMSLNLGEYFRYTSRLGKQTVTLREELHMITNYLTIQNLRMKRIAFAIEVPLSMLELEIPRLILQPVVENAILHGIEPQPEKGNIRVSGRETETEYRICIADNGRGLSDEALENLRFKLSLPADDDTGSGLWNVNKRLVLMFGEGSGLLLSRSDMGGLRIILVWNKR